jgi:hypothetical protein
MIFNPGLHVCKQCSFQQSPHPAEEDIDAVKLIEGAEQLLFVAIGLIHELVCGGSLIERG